MTLEEEIYNKMKNKILIYDIINSLKEEKENNIKFSIKNIENSIKEIKYDYKSWIEDIIICICIIEKNEKLEDLGIKKSEEKILESIYHSLPSDLSQEFHGNIGSSDKPIKNITLLIKFVRQKKQEEYNKEYNQKNITTLQRYRDQANNINGEDLKKKIDGNIKDTKGKGRDCDPEINLIQYCILNINNNESKTNSEINKKDEINEL